MRGFTFLLAATALAVAATTASAGNLTFSGGKSQWRSTRCKEPSAPTSLLAVDSETSGEQMNVVMGTYNAYAEQMQEYMNCVSDEAQNDAAVANQSIIQSAQAAIETGQRKVRDLHDTLQAKR